MGQAGLGHSGLRMSKGSRCNLPVWRARPPQLQTGCIQRHACYSCQSGRVEAQQLARRRRRRLCGLHTHPPPSLQIVRHELGLVHRSSGRPRVARSQRPKRANRPPPFASHPPSCAARAVQTSTCTTCKHDGKATRYWPFSSKVDSGHGGAVVRTSARPRARVCVCEQQVRETLDLRWGCAAKQPARRVHVGCQHCRHGNENGSYSLNHFLRSLRQATAAHHANRVDHMHGSSMCS